MFHAKPVSKRMMEAPVGVPPKKAAVLIGKETSTRTHSCNRGIELNYFTCEEPQSPAFALKSRMAERNLQKAPMPEPEPVRKLNTYSVKPVLYVTSRVAIQ